MRKLKQYAHQIKSKIWVQLHDLRFSRIQQIAYSKKQTPIPSEKQLPILKYYQLEQYFQKFMNSKSQNGRVNGQHLTLVTGGQNYGKTTFINDNIIKFIQKKNKLKVDGKHTSKNQYDIFNTPEFFEDQRRINVVENPYFLCIKSDFRVNRALNFDGFLHMFQQEILQQIKKLLEQFPSEYVLNADIIKQIVLVSKCEEYLYVYVREAIFAILEGKDKLQLRDQNLQALQQFVQQLNNNDISCTQFFNGRYYHELISIIKKELKKSQWETALLFFLCCMRRIQYEYRPIQFANTYYESGIQTVMLLFDLLDFMCGVGKLNHKIIVQYYNKNGKPAAQNVQKLRYYNFYKKHNNTYILSGNHIDTVLCIMNLEELQCYRNRDPRFLYLYDNILIRYCGSKSNLRHHFPIILQVPHTAHLKQIQNIGRFGLQNPVNLQIPGYIYFLLDATQLPRTLSHKIIDKLWNINGRSPKVWNEAIKQLAEGIPIQQILLGKSPNIQSASIKLHAKINHLYLYTQNLQHIDDNTLKYQILHLMKMTYYVNGLFETFRPYYSLLFFDKPLFQTMIKQNIYFDHAYLSGMQLTDCRSIFAVKNFYRSSMNKYGLKYWLWRLQKPYYFRRGQLKYNVKQQNIRYKYDQIALEKRQFHARYYFGGADDYQFLYKQYGVDRKIKII